MQPHVSSEHIAAGKRPLANVALVTLDHNAGIASDAHGSM